MHHNRMDGSAAGHERQPSEAEAQAASRRGGLRLFERHRANGNAFALSLLSRIDCSLASHQSSAARFSASYECRSYTALMLRPTW